jgi:hypothetical protein
MLRGVLISVLDIHKHYRDMHKQVPSGPEQANRYIPTHSTKGTRTSILLQAERTSHISNGYTPIHIIRPQKAKSSSRQQAWRQAGRQAGRPPCTTKQHSLTRDSAAPAYPPARHHPPPLPPPPPVSTLLTCHGPLSSSQMVIYPRLMYDPHPHCGVVAVGVHAESPLDCCGRYHVCPVPRAALYGLEQVVALVGTAPLTSRP